MSSNFAVLTKSHKIVASKKKAKRDQVKEVLFDEVDRRDFLTGFHKRKLQKKEEAKRKAQEREKQERLDARREKRQLLAERAAENATQVERAYRVAIVGEESGGEDDTVFTEGHGTAKVADEEYEDEEQMATVTVVEDFDPETLIHGPNTSHARQFEVPGPSELSAVHEDVHKRVNSKVRPASQVKKARAKTATRAKDIKYQTKAERKKERTKQRHRKLEKASLAGGKTSRKKFQGRGKR